MIVNENINKVVKHFKASKKGLSIEFGLSGTVFSKICSGKNIPNSEIVSKFLLKFKDIDARWLLTGEGEMFVTNNTKESVAQQVNGTNNGILTNNGTVHYNNLKEAEMKIESLEKELEMTRKMLKDKEEMVQNIFNGTIVIHPKI